MQLFSSLFIFIILFSTNLLSHSGGTDRNGCHAGSEPYHCHNSGSNRNSSQNDNHDDDGEPSLNAWDLNIGYQYHIKDTSYIPYAGLSLGKDIIYEEVSNDISVGIDLGVKLQNKWYIGYTSTSKSTKIGYGFFHFSFNSHFMGIGIHYPFNNSTNSQSSIYGSASGLF
jgi:hypothetical protein